MDDLIFAQNLTNKQAMENYLRKQFIFCGVRSPERKIIEAPYLKASLQLPVSELLALIAQNYAKEEREYQYYAIDLAIKNVRRLGEADLQALLPLVTDKA